MNLRYIFIMTLTKDNEKGKQYYRLILLLFISLLKASSIDELTLLFLKIFLKY